MNPKKQTVTVFETQQGFLWAEMGKYYKSLAALRCAVLRDAKVLAKGAGAVLTMIEVY